jgi:FimV-like protein
MVAAAICSAAMFYSTLASALGMGDITLHSALNQPLDAEIELVETAGLSADDIVAKLAPAEDFARAGIERVFFYNDLRFTPIIRGNRGVIRVVSSKPVTEPYLSFLVQLVRPNGNLLHEYTLLLDPATSPAGIAATRSRTREAEQPAPASRMPVAPPAALQGKRYTVASGDTLSSIARRVQGSGANASASKLADGIKALNPQLFASEGAALKVGQNLLLPDAAVQPSVNPAPASPAVSAPQTITPSPEAQRSAEQLTAAAIENQLLSKTVDDLKGQVLGLQEQLVGRDKQIVALQTQQAERQAAAPAPVVQAPVTPAPVAAAKAPDDSLLPSPLLLGAVLILLLLLGLAWSVRRNRRKQPSARPEATDTSLIKPAQTPVVPVYEVPAVAVRAAEPQSSVSTSRPTASAPARVAGAAPDALDGVSIYIAYGRFAEALGILRDALAKQPERTDIRIRILELLAEQGDSQGFADEERSALASGMEPQALQAVRDRYPQLKAAETAVPAVAPLAGAAVIAPLASPEPARLDESAAAALNPQPADEFQLNLDDLSMDADWDLVDPFDSPKASRPSPETEEFLEQDPTFSSNLTELPEVYEIPDEQFLSDFSEPQSIVQSNSDALDDAFLDGFMDDSSEFDLLDLDEAPLSKINQAQVLIDDGDFDAARELLLQVIEESDDEHQQTAREMLASFD